MTLHGQTFALWLASADFLFECIEVHLRATDSDLLTVLRDADDLSLASVPRFLAGDFRSPAPLPGAVCLKAGAPGPVDAPILYFHYHAHFHLALSFQSPQTAPSEPVAAARSVDRASPDGYTLRVVPMPPRELAGHARATLLAMLWESSKQNLLLPLQSAR